jgi:hypothetical protein
VLYVVFFRFQRDRDQSEALRTTVGDVTAAA